MDDLFFWLSKMFWAVTSPDHLLLFMFTFAVLLSASSKKVEIPSLQRRGRGLLWVSLLLTWSIAVYPFGNVLLLPLERQFVRPPLPSEEQLAGVIVLGGSEHLRNSLEWSSLETNEAAERLLVMSELLRYYPDAAFIYSGGSSSISDQTIRGADVVKVYLQGLGLEKRVMFERNSRNTYENALFSMPLMKPRKSAKWLLVTSAFHMPRAVGVFRRQGIDVLPYPVDFRSSAHQSFHFDLANNLSGFKGVLREWIGLLAYRFTGKTSSLLPSPVPMLVVSPESNNE
ncbi:MAG: YdcF family protein [Motiliproteus sp.]